MAGNQRKLSLRMYYLLVSSLVNLVFILLTWIVLTLIPGYIDLVKFILTFLIVFFEGRALILGFMLEKSQHFSPIDKEIGTRGIGQIQGRYFGLIIGGISGALISEIPGAIVGAIAFYFAGRWIGGMMGLLFGRVIIEYFLVADVPLTPWTSFSPLRRRLTVVAFALFPWTIVLLGFSSKVFGVPLFLLPEKWLPLARIVAIILSLVIFAIPQFLEKRIPEDQSKTRKFSMFWIGLSFADIPVFYGFILFLGGASLLELCFFACACSFAVILWGSRYEPS